MTGPHSTSGWLTAGIAAWIVAACLIAPVIAQAISAHEREASEQRERKRFATTYVPTKGR